MTQALGRAAALAAVLFVGATPAAARIVDYALDDAGYAETAVRLKIAPVADLPKTDAWHVDLSAGPGIDHQTLPLGMYCAVKVENPLSLLVKSMAARFSPASSATRLAVRITEARSYRRCVEAREKELRCLTRVRLIGEAQASDARGDRRFRVTADIERSAWVGALCAGVAEGTGVISRQAVIALVNDAIAQAEAATP